jgi:hypothetical protein
MIREWAIPVAAWQETSTVHPHQSITEYDMRTIVQAQRDICASTA